MATQRRRKPLSTMAILTLIILAILAAGAIALFAYQTWEFVNWLFPVENLLMKVLAVVNFDIFSYVWLMVGLFLAPFLHHTSKSLAFIVGIVTFLLSLACSVIQMMLASAERYLTNINPNIVYFAYALVILALVINIVTVLTLLHIQWPYISGEKVLALSDPSPQQPGPHGGISVQPVMDERAIMQLAQMLADRPDVREAITGHYQVLPETRQTSPLAQSPVEKDKANGAH